MSTRIAASLLATVFAAASFLAGLVDASAAPNRKAMSSVQGQFKFGMSIRAVCKVLEKRIDERYAEKIAATTDPFVQDKLRALAKLEYKRIAASYVRFRGKAKGWDVSIIDKEFAHKSGESMLVSWDDKTRKNSRRFFFFFRGKLYKTLTALDMSKLAGAQKKFSVIKRILERKFGTGRVSFVTKDGIKEPAHIDWYAKSLWVRASDKLRFHNVFIIAAVDRAMWKRVATERAKHVSKKERNRILKSIVNPDGSKPGLDEDGDVIKEITSGKKNKRR